MTLLQAVYDASGLAAAEIHRDQARTYLIEATDAEETPPDMIEALALLAQAHTAQAALELQMQDVDEMVTEVVLSLEAQQVLRYCLAYIPAAPVIAWIQAGATWEMIAGDEEEPRPLFYSPTGPLEERLSSGDLSPEAVAEALACDVYRVGEPPLLLLGMSAEAPQDWQATAEALRSLLSLDPEE